MGTPPFVAKQAQMQLKFAESLNADQSFTYLAGDLHSTREHLARYLGLAAAQESSWASPRGIFIGYFTAPTNTPSWF